MCRASFVNVFASAYSRIISDLRELMHANNVDVVMPDFVWFEAKDWKDGEGRRG